MNGYVCFWRGKKAEVYAETSFEAQKKAAEIFKAKKTYEISVVLAEKNGNPVIHSTSNI